MRGPEVGAWARQNQRHCHVRRPRQVHAAVQVRPQPRRAQARSIWGAVQKAAKRASRSDSTTCRGRCSFRISDRRRRRRRHRRRRRRRHRCHRCSRSPSPLRSRRLFPPCYFRHTYHHRHRRCGHHHSCFHHRCSSSLSPLPSRRPCPSCSYHHARNCRCIRPNYIRLPNCIPNCICFPQLSNARRICSGHASHCGPYQPLPHQRRHLARRRLWLKQGAALVVAAAVATVTAWRTSPHCSQ